MALFVMNKRNFLKLHISSLVFVFIAVSCKDVDLFYSETFERPFHDLNFKSLEDSTVNLKKRDTVLFQQAEDNEDEEDSNETDDGGMKLPNETAWWNTNGNETHYERINHRYYTATWYKPEANKFNDYWIPIANLLNANNKTIKGDVQHKQLSNSYRRAVSQKLSFKFPFYGHETENITIATGGFVYVGEHVHSWLAATQYIAPLMANFDTTTSDDSNLMFADTGDYFVVEWNQVVLRHQTTAGNFTFQVSLHKNGDIWFVYKSIPIEVKHVSDLHHPRKVGLSDAYLFTHTVLTLSRRVIYEYHRVEIPLENVKSGAVVVIKANPVCIAVKNCRECMTTNFTQFNCSWCIHPEERGGGFCSDEAGLHRRRQDWIDNNCNKQSREMYCSESSSVAPAVAGSPSPSVQTSTSSGGNKSAVSVTWSTNKPETVGNGSYLNSGHSEISMKKIQQSGLSAGGILAILFILAIVAALVGWVLYAYHNPQSPSGQFLIRYRPSRWRWPNSHGDVRYTASVHM